MNQTLDNDPYALAADLPVPVDDGTCNHLARMKILSLSLRSTGSRYIDIARVSRGQVVLFFYPETGRPGDPIPKSWNNIPGARGCTPQSCAFRDHYREFKDLGFEVFGVSAQSFDEQLEFAKRNNLPYELLNDSDFKLINALRLPTFEFQSKIFVRRLALVARQGRIEKVFYPVFPPDKNAEAVLDYLRRSSPERSRVPPAHSVNATAS